MDEEIISITKTLRHKGWLSEAVTEENLEVLRTVLNNLINLRLAEQRIKLKFDKNGSSDS